jgi:hypothetical protein
MFREGIYRRSDLMTLDTIEQAWDGDSLVIDSGDEKVWLTHRENRDYNGDYVYETLCPVTGRWEQESFLFKK